MATTLQKKGAKTRRVLVVDDEPELRELIGRMVRERLACDAMVAGSIGEARRILDHRPVELLVTDVNLPDGNGMSLLPLLHERQPLAHAIVITGDPNTDGVIHALRQGAVDFVPKPFSADELTDRVERALERQREHSYRTGRLKTLRSAVKRLNEARKLVSRKVDLLCNDLIGAYGELSRQFDEVRLQQGYRTFVGETTDLEQLLCHTMDWLMRQLGYSNVGIWLASDDQEFSLGAYMKYTIAGEASVTEALERNLVRMTARKGFVHVHGEEAREVLTAPELKFLANQDVMAVNCTYLGDTLGVIAMFRDAKTPFNDDDVAALKMMSPLFSASLTRAVKTAQGGEGEAATEEPDDDGGDTKLKPPKRRPKHDPADWWKNGDSPPF